jgi:hypothetical protein
VVDVEVNRFSILRRRLPQRQKPSATAGKSIVKPRLRRAAQPLRGGYEKDEGKYNDEQQYKRE